MARIDEPITPKQLTDVPANEASRATPSHSSVATTDFCRWLASDSAASASSLTLPDGLSETRLARASVPLAHQTRSRVQCLALENGLRGRAGRVAHSRGSNRSMQPGTVSARTRRSRMWARHGAIGAALPVMAICAAGSARRNAAGSMTGSCT